MNVTINVITNPLDAALSVLKTRADKSEFLRCVKKSDDVFKLKPDLQRSGTFIAEPSDALVAFLSGDSPQMVRAELEGIR